MTPTTVLGETPEITAPVRLEGQTDADVLFNWLLVNRFLWVLDPDYDEALERIVGSRALLQLAHLRNGWKRQRNAAGHPALAAPEDEESQRAAFARLERLVRAHLFDAQQVEGGAAE